MDKRDVDGDPDEASDIEEEPTSPHVVEVQKVELKPADFYFGSTLGEGAYARVVHAKSKKTSAQFAIKIMEKVHIKKENKVICCLVIVSVLFSSFVLYLQIKYVMMERHILTMVSHPFIIKLVHVHHNNNFQCFTHSLLLDRFHFSFQDPGYLYMCMDFAPGGDLLGLITHEQNRKQKMGRTNEACDFACAQFYIAEIVEAVEYLHGMQILHRDLKPESTLPVFSKF